MLKVKPSPQLPPASLEVAADGDMQSVPICDRVLCKDGNWTMCQEVQTGRMFMRHVNGSWNWWRKYEHDLDSNRWWWQDSVTNARGWCSAGQYELEFY